MNNLIIRDFSGTDVEEIWRLGAEVAQFETSQEVVTFWPRDILENLVDKPDIIFKVAEINEEIVGFIIWNLNLSLKKAQQENLFVGPEFRKKGIGENLLGEATAEARLRGIEFISALVKSDSAIRFMENRGFERGNDFVWMDLVLDDKFKKEKK